MKVAITGSTGFLGRGLALALISSGHKVLHITRNLVKCRLVFGDAADFLDIGSDDRELIEVAQEFGPDVFVHAATHFSRSRDFSDLQRILNGTLTNSIRIFEAARHIGVPFLNFNSMWQVSSDPVLAGSPYAAAKEAFRTYIHQANLGGLQIVRDLFVPDTFGPGDTRGKIIQTLLESRKGGSEPTINNPDALLDLVYAPALTSFLQNELPRISDLPRSLAVIHYPEIKITDLREFILGDGFQQEPEVDQPLDYGVDSHSRNSRRTIPEFLEVVFPAKPKLSQALRETLH